MSKKIPLNHTFAFAHDKILIRPLNEGDWNAYMDWTKQIFRTRALLPKEIKEIEDKTPAGWQGVLSEPDMKFFAAFDQGKIVAISRVAMQTRYLGAREAVLEVSDGYNGRGVGTQLYAMMKSHMAVHHADEHLIARILPNNGASRRAAEKAGLVYTGYTERATMVSLGYMVYGVAAQNRVLTPEILKARLG